MGEHKLVQLARSTIEEYVLQGTRKEVPGEMGEFTERKAGVFVSLKKEGNLRGCIGTTRPTRENIAREVIANAISAATRDPRFPSIKADELDKLEISVDVLGEEEKIESIDQLDPDRYGVIVKKGRKTGLLLPDLEGVDSAEEQVRIASRKAGILRNEDVDLYRFRVDRYE